VTQDLDMAMERCRRRAESWARLNPAAQRRERVKVLHWCIRDLESAGLDADAATMEASCLLTVDPVNLWATA
jgi:hypothetical protein